jgi:hypothetical protein
MMNTIVFTKKPNKQKNIEKCSHITAQTAFEEEQWGAVTSPDMTSQEVASPEVESPEMTSPANKQKNIEKCSHILHTHTTESINHG